MLPWETMRLRKVKDLPMSLPSGGARPQAQVRCPHSAQQTQQEAIPVSMPAAQGSLTNLGVGGCAGPPETSACGGLSLVQLGL